MKLNVPLVYDVAVIPPRSRKGRTETFMEWLEVEVEDLSDADAPVALQWDANAHFDRESVGPRSQRRWHGGRLWEPCVRSVSGQPNEQVSAADVARACSSGHVYANPLLEGVEWKVRQAVRDGVRPFHPRQYRESEKNGRDRAIREAAGRAAETVFIDGAAWTRAAEPVYVAAPSRVDGAYIYVNLERPSPKNASHAFRLDRFEQMAAWTELCWGAAPEPSKEVEVLIPECLSYDDEKAALRACLFAELQSAMPRIGEQARPVVLSYLDLRDAIDDLMHSPAPEAAGKAASAARAWQLANEAEAAADAARLGRDVPGTEMLYFDRLRAGLARWEGKEISLEEIASPGPRP